MIIKKSLKNKQIEALWESAYEALISQMEFFTILNEGGATALLDKYVEKGVLSLSKPSQAEMNFELMANQE